MHLAGCTEATLERVASDLRSGGADVHGTPPIVEDFARPIESMLRSNFLTAQATGRHMVRQARA
ncbi:MAG TPA: hypothetical protein VG126_10675 [Thermoleophilaceae bacterium]|nr:hypothetical protein [Thermoleophilaceae bacterium]